MIDHDDASFDVVICGGSFAGLALARALSISASGFNVAVIDPIDLAVPYRKKSDGRAFALSAASQRMARMIGIWDKLSRDAQPIRHIDITDSALQDGERPVFLYFDNALEEGDFASFMVESSQLQQALIDVARADDQICFYTPDTVLGFDADLHGVQVKLGSGRRLRTRLLVAADGAQSQLRERAGIKCVGWSYEQYGLVARIGHEKPHEGRAVQHFLPSGPFAILPLTENRSSLVWTEEAASARAVLAFDDDVFLAHVRRRFGEFLGNLSLAGGRGGFPLNFQIARSFKADRLALVGDAAHAVHPLAGQGLNIGWRDVAALAQIIVDDLRLGLDFGSNMALARYERWRRFDSTMSAFAMDGINRLFSNDDDAVRGLRDLGLSLVNKAPVLKAFFVREAAGLSGDVPRLLRGEPI